MDKEQAKTRLLEILIRHVGRHRAIGMGELFQMVYGETWNHRINDTRILRTLITSLRKEGTPICSVVSAAGGGYYLASAGSELETYCKNLRRSALRKLALEAKIRKKTLPELVGQISLNLTD